MASPKDETKPTKKRTTTKRKRKAATGPKIMSDVAREAICVTLDSYVGNDFNPNDLVSELIGLMKLVMSAVTAEDSRAFVSYAPPLAADLIRLSAHLLEVSCRRFCTKETDRKDAETICIDVLRKIKLEMKSRSNKQGEQRKDVN